MKHAKFAVAAMLLFFGLSVSSRAQDQSNQYYQAGNSMYAQKNYDMAIRYYQASVQVNPQMWQAYQGEGNCYYAKGDKSNALTNYQKALSINSNNPQLSSFVQTLQAQLGSAPPLPAGNNGTSVNAGSSAETSSSAKFVLAPMAGLAYCTSSGYGLGFGGGLSGYFPGGDKLFFGGSAAFYTFGGASSNYGGTTINQSISNIEILAALKYMLGTGGMRPYLIGGAGLSLFSVSASASVSGYGNIGASASTSDPMIEAGGGLEFAAGNSMDFFVEAKYSVIIGSGGTVSYLPITGGLAFNL